MAVKNEQAIVELVIKGQAANDSIKDIEKASRALRAQMRGLAVDSQEYADKTKEFKKVEARLAAIRAETKATGTAFKSVGQDLKAGIADYAKAITPIVAVSMAVRRVYEEFKHAIQLQREFEKSLKNLQAITGASAEDMLFYKDAAREMGIAVEGGAVAVVEAIKLIGSAKPELLENKAALVEITKQAILLSQAAGLELPDAATRLTDALNQFGAPAKDAARYVDALAAAAKYGSAEVPQVTEALLKFGVSAKSFNVDIYESAAAIELLAEKGLKGAEAGTMLRNIFAKMSAADILPAKALAQLADAGVNIQKIKDQTIPLSERLRELSKITGNASAITEVFGLENKTAGEIIIANLPRYAELTAQVKEIGVATTQAATNMDTLDQAIVTAGNSWDNFLLGAAQGGIGDGLKKQLNTFSTIMSVAGVVLGDWDKQIAASNKKRIDGLSEYMKRFEMEQLALELKALQNTILNSKNTSDAVWKYYGETAKKKIEIYNQYKQSLSEGAAEEVATEKTKGEKVVTVDAETKRKLLEEAKRHKEELRKAEEKFYLDVAELEKKNSYRYLNDREREKAEAFAKYRELLGQAQTNSVEQQAILEAQNNELLDIDKKYNDKALKIKEDYLADRRRLENSEMQNEIDEVTKQYDDVIQLALEHNEEAISLEFAKWEAIADIQRKYKAAAKEQSPDEKKAEQKRIQDGQDLYNAYYGTLNSLAATHDAKQKSIYQSEITRINKTTDQAISQQKSLLDNKIISEETYNARVEELDAAREKKSNLAKAKSAQIEKDAALYSALINGAVAVTNIWAKHAYAPPIAAALTAAAVATSAFEIAAIEAAPTPEYATGGFVKDKSLFKSSTGGNFIAGEAGEEWIAPNWMVRDPVYANIIGTLEGARNGAATRAGGGNFSAAASPGNNSTQMSGEMTAAINRMNQMLERLERNGIEANLDFDNYRKDLKSIDNAKKSGAIN